MDPMTMMALASVAAPVVGGLLGQDQAKGANKAAEDAAKRASGAFSGIELPDIEKMKLALEEYTRTGEYNPLVEQALQLGPSALEQVQVDPRLRQNQMQALQAVADKSQTGLSQADMAAFELARRNSAAGEQSRQQQILQNLAQRGQAGGGAEIAMRAISSQKEADRQALEGLDMAGRQEQARMQALQSLSQMSSGLRNQDYGEAANLAAARDAMNKYNVMNNQNVNERNIGTKNLAQQRNLGEQQRIADANVSQRNTQQQFNKGLLQQNFNNQIQRAGGIAGSQAPLINQANNQAANTAGGYAQIGNAIGTGAGAYAQYLQNQPKPGAVDAAGGTTQASLDYLRR